VKVLLSGISFDRVELNLIKALRSSGIELMVIAVPKTTAAQVCEEHAIPYVTHTFRNRIDRDAVRLFRRLQEEHRFDIFHCLTNRALATALTAQRKMVHKPKIIAYRGTMGHLSWFDPAAHFSYLNKRLDCIICVSGAVKTYLKKFRIPDERLEVIWKGHDPSWYSSAPRSALTELGIPEDAVAVSFVGNIRPVKGVEYLLRAFNDYSGKENMHLIIIGDVRDEKVNKEAELNPRIHFTGYRNDATALVGACDIAVMPSVEREGLPKAILEAMAQSIPAVVTHVGGLPELVIDGECGLVVPPRNSDALRAALTRLAADPSLRKKMGIAARQRVEGEFNFSRTLAKTLALYRRLLG